MRNHTTPRIHELTSTAGKNPTLTPGSSVQTATFLLNNIPTGKEGKFWYYCSSIVVELRTSVDQPSMGSAAIDADKLWKIMASFQVQTPLLGNLFSHANTRGATMGNLIQYIGAGYNANPVRAQIAASDGDTAVILQYRIPFAYEFLRKPHETAPWGGFFEGGTMECKLDVSTVLDGDSTGAVTEATTSLRAWMELIPSPEACIHTPVHWREHITPGSSTKHIIQDMGSPDGLQGIDQSKGVGLGALLLLSDATGIGLGGSDGNDNITGVDIPWRDQPRIDAVMSLMQSWHTLMGVNRTSKVPTNDGGGFPYTIAATPNGDLMPATALVYPLVAPGRDVETSKLQTVSGAKEINLSYTSTPSGSSRFLGCYFPTFDQNYMQTLAARIAPGASGQLVAKTLNKQAGGIHGVGKLAYVRAKVL